MRGNQPSFLQRVLSVQLPLGLTISPLLQFLILLTGDGIFASVQLVTTTKGHSGERFDRFGPVPQARCLPWIIICWLLCISLDVQAGPLITTESPIGFFTYVATRLLQSQLGISLNHIQLYPTNQYTPSVHRLLQVTANLYDAITNRADTGYPYLPSVFRPVFASQLGGGGNQIYISGYQEVPAADTLNLAFNPTPPHDLSDPNDRAVAPLDMVYGIP